MRSLSTVTILLTACFATACGDDDDPRPLNAPCSDDGQCISGLCVSSTCLEPGADDDGDGLINSFEASLGSNPLASDSDMDGVLDGDELTDLANRDSDGDGVPDINESGVLDDDKDCLSNELDAINDLDNPATDIRPMIAKVCRLEGVCLTGAASLDLQCPSGGGLPTCIYDTVADYEEGVETECDGLDNNCDGVVDDGLDCTSDGDGDGLDDDVDNCPLIANTTQDDTDGDGTGDACDPPTRPTVTATAPPSPAPLLSPNVVGSADPAAIVTIFSDLTCTNALGSATASADGSFAIASTVPAPNTSTKLFVNAENAAGLVSDCVDNDITYRHDDSAPPTPTIDALALTSWKDAPFEYGFDITASGEVDARLVAYAQSGCSGDTTQLGSLGESGTLAAELVAAGPVYVLSARAVDLAGNVSDCTDAIPLIGPAALSTVGAGDGQPVGGVPVRVHGPDGAVIESVATDSGGEFTGTSAHGMALTVVTSTAPPAWMTTLEVGPESPIVATIAQSTVATHSLELSWPNVPAGTVAVEVITSCDNNYFDVSEQPAVVTMKQACSGVDAFSLYAEARDASGQLVGTATIVGGTFATGPAPDATVTALVLDNWAVPSQDLTITVNNTGGADVVVKLIPMMMSQGRQLESLADVEGPIAADVVQSVTTTFPTVADALFGMWFILFGDDGEGGGSRLMFWGGQFADDFTVNLATDAPPTVTSGSFEFDDTTGRPTINWTADASLADQDVHLALLQFESPSSDVLTWNVFGPPNDDGVMQLPVADATLPGAALITEALTSESGFGAMTYDRAANYLETLQYPAVLDFFSEFSQRNIVGPYRLNVTYQTLVPLTD